jgi:hypothetical protein
MEPTDFFSKFNAGEIIGLVAVAGGLLCGILCGVTAILTDFWQNIRKAEIAAALKRDMLARGMSSDEIRTVIEAGLKGSKKEMRSQQPCNE